MKLVLITTLVMTLFANVAVAQSSASVPLNYTDIGAGTRSCGSWLADKQTDAATTVFTIFLGDQQFVLGYIVGFEEFRGQQTQKNVMLTTDANGVYGWIDNYCEAHSVDTLTDAAQAFALLSGTIKISR